MNVPIVALKTLFAINVEKHLALPEIWKFIVSFIQDLNLLFVACVEKLLVEKQKFAIMNEPTLGKNPINVNSVALLLVNEAIYSRINELLITKINGINAMIVVKGLRGVAY